METGEYVRLKSGEIFKADENTANYYNANKEYITNEVEKHSLNILDLMEIRDFINTDYGWGWFVRKNNENEILLDTGDEYIEVEKDQIQGILTNEKMEESIYRIKKEE